MFMQTNKQQTASFPFLGGGISDYKKTVFDLKVERGFFKDGKILLEATYSINNDEINELISNGKLSVVVSLFCQPVGLNISKKIPADAKNIRFIVDKMDVDKALEFSALLVVEEPFLYTNSDLSNDWSGEEYYIEKYNEIGVSAKVVIPVEHKKEGKKSSIFQFQELPTLDPLAPAYYDTDGDVIYFIVPRQLFKMYNKVQSRKHEVILASFIIPALTDILRQMINPSDTEINDFNLTNENKKWYRVITEKYKALYKKDPCDGEVEPYKAAQALVKSPLNNLLAFVKNWINNSEEGDE